MLRIFVVILALVAQASGLRAVDCGGFVCGTGMMNHGEMSNGAASAGCCGDQIDGGGKRVAGEGGGAACECCCCTGDAGRQVPTVPATPSLLTRIIEQAEMMQPESPPLGGDGAAVVWGVATPVLSVDGRLSVAQGVSVQRVLCRWRT